MTLNSSMAEALRLTRAGSLSEATALIHATLSGGAPLPVASPPAGEVIDLIAERVSVTHGPDRAQRARASVGGRFEPRRHVGAAGVIDYLLYVPAAAAQNMPLVVMLHGCMQSPEDFARGTAMNKVAEEKGFLVAYPRQTSRANPQKCWNWFRPEDQERGRGEPALLVGLADDIVETEGVDRARIYVAGLSAGGAAAAILAEAYPDLFAAIGIHSGIGCGIARDLPSALAAMKRGAGSGRRQRRAGGRFVPVITFHGDRDVVVGEVNARDIVSDAAAATGGAVRVEVEAGDINGRRYTRAITLGDGDRALIEQWTIAGAGHAWSGGDPAGSFADAAGPNASLAMAEFFLQHTCPS